jgi:hypothetical protein
MVESSQHDACITWRLGNSTVILQNVVVFENECTAPKIDFWTRFIDLYYQSSGGAVSCCDNDGCNTGTEVGMTRQTSGVGGETADGGSGFGSPSGAVANSMQLSIGSVPGAPLIFAPGQQQGLTQ